MADLLRRAQPSDTAGICALLQTVFPDNPKADPAVYAWQYWDNPFGAPMSWVCEREGRIVGHAGLFRCPGWLGDRPRILGHGADAAIAADHRGRGLFSQLAARRYADAVQHGLAATLTLPNARSRHANERAGLVLAGRVRAFLRPLTPPTSRHRARRPRWEEVRAVPQGLDDLWEHDLQSRDGIRRDAQWWRWRYEGRPGGGYRVFVVRRDDGLAAALATSVRRVRGVAFVHVMDLLARDLAAARAVLQGPVSRRVQPGTRAAVLLALPGGPTARLARRCGFLPLPRALEPQPMLLGVAAPPALAPVVAAARWRVSWADHDHV